HDVSTKHASGANDRDFHDVPPCGLVRMTAPDL
ncbi:MAG: hypothetical protein ACI8PT_005023, partial [Gammaproteobacteria bacterium]